MTLEPDQRRALAVLADTGLNCSTVDGMLAATRNYPASVREHPQTFFEHWVLLNQKKRG
jgi:hypothetical protein